MVWRTTFLDRCIQEGIVLKAQTFFWRSNFGRPPSLTLKKFWSALWPTEKTAPPPLWPPQKFWSLPTNRRPLLLVKIDASLTSLTCVPSKVLLTVTSDGINVVFTRPVISTTRNLTFINVFIQWENGNIVCLLVFIVDSYRILLIYWSTSLQFFLFEKERQKKYIALYNTMYM